MNMNQYTMPNSLRTILFSMMALGAICLGITWFTDEHGDQVRFWSNVLHNSVFFTGIAIMATFFMAASITAYAGWYTAFKRVFESMSSYLIPGFIIMTILGIVVFVGGNHLYHWNDISAKEDKILVGKSGFLNKYWYLFATVLIGLAYIYLSSKLRSLSAAEESAENEENFNTHRKIRTYAAAFLPVFGFTSVVLIWQWVMSVDSHWYSTMFAWYSLASLFVAMMCLVALILLYLRSNGYFANLSKHHIHDVGKFIFGISVFWTYLWFSQFMLIWYANIGEETIYFKERYEKYPVIFFLNLGINFALPFLVLLRNDNKWKKGSLSFIAIVVFLGHWLDYFLMIKPGVLHTSHELAAHHRAGHHGAEAAGHGVEHGGHAVSSIVSGFTFPGFLEVGTMLGFLGLFLYVVFSYLTKNNLSSAKDPYMQESLHHHV
ncbi:MAG: hypothetical protein RLZZ546_2714 [Bacteroidota bacterium]|jgi:hypothetical protein